MPESTVIMTDLREVNATAQRKVRELEDAVDKVNKVSEIAQTISRGIQLLAGL